jgi:hypothetical protein
MTKIQPTYVKARMLSKKTISNDVRDFDAVDNKGRRFGYRVRIVQTEFVADETSRFSYYAEHIGVSFNVMPQSMRGGYDFGAIPVNAAKICKTLSEAQAAAETMFAKAAKAAAKKAGA